MDQENDIEMVVAGLVLDPASNAPIVILKEPEGDICLPIWIGLAEAQAIASALKNVEVIRPMTHDLLVNLCSDLGGKVQRVVICALKDNTFFANVEVSVGDALKIIDARPSDAIALAVRVKAPIMVKEEVLEQAQVTLVAVSAEENEAEGVDVEPSGGQTEDKNFATIEKDRWADILAEMDPDDFKYKM
ncbi:MAG: bifunctional nuclease family protein [Bdellovibrionales bacterium]|nr:bifunctional nuclease family protein [Bdellovibrionales bacterium]